MFLLGSISKSWGVLVWIGINYLLYFGFCSRDMDLNIIKKKMFMGIKVSGVDV